MTEDILIGGVSLKAFKEQRQAMLQDANKIVAEQINLGAALAKQIAAPDNNEITEAVAGSIAEQALKHFQLASDIAETVGVTYYLDYNEEWGHTGDKLPLSNQLEASGFDTWGGALSELLRQIEMMEGASRDWHSSTC